MARDPRDFTGGPEDAPPPPPQLRYRRRVAGPRPRRKWWVKLIPVGIGFAMLAAYLLFG